MIWQSLTRPILLGVRSLRLHKLRSLLTILGVVFGVASVIIMMAIGHGARQEAVQAIQELGATNIILRTVKPADMGDDGGSTGAIRYGLTHQDLRRISQGGFKIKEVAPTREHRRRFTHQDRRFEGRVVGVTPAYQSLNDIRLQQGRFIEQLDCQGARCVVVLGAAAANALFTLDEPLGKHIRIGEDRFFQVVGVAEPRGKSAGLGGNLTAQDYGRDVYLPFPTDQQRFGENIVFDPNGSQLPEKVDVSQITVSVWRMGDVRPTARLLESVLEEGHSLQDAVMTVPLDLLDQAEQTQRMFTLVLTAIASISLLVGGIGIMNIMLATVTERTREIGIRRALGARRDDIIWQFLVETSVLSGCGGILGVGLGLAGVLVAAQLTGMPTSVQPWAPVLAFVISVAVGLVFGVYPARRAAQMDPIQALRQ